jgi:hypothetical protein
LPQALGRIGEQLQSRYADGDRQYVGILQAVPLLGESARLKKRAILLLT